MNRDQLIRKLRKYARKNNILFEVDEKRGSGSHYLVRLGDKWTTVQSSLKLGIIERLLKQLNVDASDL